MHSIRFEITAITIAAILTTILCVFAASYTTLQAENDKTSVETMNLIGQDTRKSVEKYTESIEQSMAVISNTASDTLDRVVLAENNVFGQDAENSGRTDEQQKALDDYLAGYLSRIRETFAGYATHTHGVTAYYYCLSPELSSSEHGFFYTRAGKTGFAEQEPLDAGKLDPNDPEHDAWYFESVMRGRPTWVNLYRSRSMDEMWFCSYVIPIYKSGTFIGLIGMDLPAETLAEQVSSIKVYDTGFVCLLDEEGQVICHPEMEVGEVMDLSGLPFHEELMSEDSNGDKLIRYTKDGEERQVSFCTLSNGMKLVVVAPVKEIKASWIRLLRNNVLLTAVITVIFAVLILFVMRFITLPLKDLTAASQRLAASDYDVELPYKGRNEVGTLTHAFVRMRDQIKDYVENLNHQIYYDKLTDLPNMRHFFKLSAAEKIRLLESGESPATMYFDIIGMKNINRQYGFEAGDRMICEFAEILSGQFGRWRVCRYSGDHFAAVTSEKDCESQLQELFRKCDKANDGKGIQVRAGVYPGSLEMVDDNLACDRAKYACDQNRGSYISCFSVFDEAMLKRGEVYRYVINNLDKAISEQWLQVYYQPIVRAANGKVCDEEALSRWIDPVAGFLSPGDFIPALEESKLIYKLDLYVVDRILEKLKRQADAGMYLVPQSVNLSRMDFDSCDIVEEIRRRVDDAGIDRSLLTIEITESVIGSDFDFMKQQVIRFQEMGFQVWMDDFGSGYSSLDVLQNIRFDLIKFDMRFMDGFDSGEEGKIILTEMAKMALGLGVEMVCEGVEQEEQVEFLREIGCTKIQGYYYGKPIPFEKILELKEQGRDLGLENPEESGYYSTIGRINLYDMGMLTAEGDESLNRYFDTLPMCIMEVNGDKMRYNRCNKSYRDFLKRTLGIRFSTQDINYFEKQGEPGWIFMSAVMRCSRDGKEAVVDEKVGDTTIHTFMRRVAVNPVTGTAAVAAAVLAVI